MTAFYALLGVAVVASLVWFAAQALRRPSNLRLQAVFAMALAWLVSYPFGLIASADGGAGLDPLDARAVEHVLRVVAAGFLLLFILFSIGPAPHPWRTVRLQLVPLVAVGAGMLLAAAAVPGPLRAATADLAGGDVDGGGPVGLASVSLFYLLENLYYAYVVVIALVRTVRVLPDAVPPLCGGLRTASTGLAALSGSCALLVAANVVRWAGAVPPRTLTAVGLVLLAAGLVLLPVGLAYPSVRIGIRELAVAREHRRRYHELEPLWRRLNEAFPQDRLPDRPGGGSRRYPFPAPIRRRYYRRVVECRDGLVRLSPYLRETAGDEFDPAVLPSPRMLDGALAAYRRDVPVGTTAEPVAATEGTSIDDDARRLVELARRLE